VTELSVALLRAGTLIQRLEDHGLFAGRRWTISEEPRSPWIMVTATPTSDDDHVRAFRFAIWRDTALLFPVADDGTIGDTPINIGDVDRE
jgi:hypothetical protein